MLRWTTGSRGCWSQILCRIGRAINDSVLDPRLARQRCACLPVRPQQRDCVAGSARHASGHFGVSCASTTHLRRCGAGGSATANTSCDSRRGGPGVLVGEAGRACSQRHVAESVPSLASDRNHTNGSVGGRRGCKKCYVGTRRVIGDSGPTVDVIFRTFLFGRPRCVVSVRALRCWLACRACAC